MFPKISGLLPFVLGAALGSGGFDRSQAPVSTRPTPAGPSRPQSAPQPATRPANRGLTARLGPIRANFRRINAIQRWSAVVNAGLDEPGEGGEATFYYAKGRLEKLAVRHYGEMGQRRVDYYLLSGQLSFVLEKSYRYNRPIYYDSAAMRAEHDTEAFAFDASEVEEQRSYFAQGRLLHRLPRPAPGPPATRFLQQEQNRIKAEFRAVLRNR